MITVAAVLALEEHIRAVVRAEDDFAVPILILEGVAASVVLVIVGAVGGMIRFLRKDDAYTALLRRRDVPERCPFPPAEGNSPD